MACGPWYRHGGQGLGAQQLQPALLLQPPRVRVSPPALPSLKGPFSEIGACTTRVWPCGAQLSPLLCLISVSPALSPFLLLTTNRSHLPLPGCQQSFRVCMTTHSAPSCSLSTQGPAGSVLPAPPPGFLASLSCLRPALPSGRAWLRPMPLLGSPGKGSAPQRSLPICRGAWCPLGRGTYRGSPCLAPPPQLSEEGQVRGKAQAVGASSPPPHGGQKAPPSLPPQGQGWGRGGEKGG